PVFRKAQKGTRAQPLGGIAHLEQGEVATLIYMIELGGERLVDELHATVAVELAQVDSIDGRAVLQFEVVSRRHYMVVGQEQTVIADHEPRTVPGGRANGGDRRRGMREEVRATGLLVRASGYWAQRRSVRGGVPFIGRDSGDHVVHHRR